MSNNQEFQCRRCENIFTFRSDEADPVCCQCGSLAVETTDNKPDDLDILRTGSGG